MLNIHIHPELRLYSKHRTGISVEIFLAPYFKAMLQPLITAGDSSRSNADRPLEKKKQLQSRCVYSICGNRCGKAVVLQVLLGATSMCLDTQMEP